jgi:type I restriction enzyme R subunit
MSAQQFLESLFGALPEFFKDEKELRTIWSDPMTRKALIERLAEKGFGKDQLAEMQTIIDADKSDLFDVLAYVAFALPTETRAARATQANHEIASTFSIKQREFLDFVLGQYVQEGVEELDAEKLTPLLQLKYHSIQDATSVLGDTASIRTMFLGFQKYLYQSHKSTIDNQFPLY